MQPRLVVVVLALCITLAGCKNPRDQQLPQDLTHADASTREAIRRLSPVEQKLLMAYEMRHVLGATFGGKSIPAGLTIGQAIDREKAFESTETEQQTAEAALKAKVEKQRADAMAKMNRMITVALIAKGFEPSNFETGQDESQITLKIAVQNNTDKAISGVKGLATFKDIFGDVITRSQILITEGIQPKGQYIWPGAMDYNEFEHSDQTLRNTPFEKIKFAFQPEMIVFADGSKVSQPSGDE